MHFAGSKSRYIVSNSCQPQYYNFQPYEVKSFDFHANLSWPGNIFLINIVKVLQLSTSITYYLQIFTSTLKGLSKTSKMLCVESIQCMKLIIIMFKNVQKIGIVLFNISLCSFSLISGNQFISSFAIHFASYKIRQNMVFAVSLLPVCHSRHQLPNSVLLPLTNAESELIKL